MEPIKINFTETGISNILGKLGLKKDEIKSISIGGSMFIIVKKNGTIVTVNYEIENPFNRCIKQESHEEAL